MALYNILLFMTVFNVRALYHASDYSMIEF